MNKRLLVILLVSSIGTFASAQCDITNLVVEPFGCEGGQFYVHLDFDIVNPEGDVFGVVGNATDYGFFDYDSLPVTIGPLPGDGVTNWQFIVYDLGDPTCQETFNLGTFDCCTISNVSVTNIMCQNLQSYSAVVNLSHSNTGNLGFEVYAANGNFLGFFNYSALPVTVTGIPSFGIGTTHLTICDNNNEDCCTVYEYADPDCNPNDCEIYNVNVTFNDDCAQGQFTVTLDFDHENAGGMFTVTGSGNNYGTFSYDSLPVVLGPLDGDGETIYEFVVTSNSDMTCSGFDVLGPIVCPPDCGFLEVNVDPLECQEMGFYRLALNFEPVAVGSDSFQVYAQGNLLGTFPYDSLPVIVDNFPASCGFFDELIICDQNDTTCCDTVEFEALLCCGCLLYNFSATPTVCDPQDEFTVSVNFNYHDVGGQGFVIAGNGTNYGTFQYDALPIILGPFSGDSLTFYEFLVYDVENGLSCITGGELGIVNCECGFESISVTPMECSGNGTFSLLLNFEPVEVINQFFDVYAGDEFVGFYAYANLPIVIEHFPDAEGTDVITICDNDNPTCCASFEFDGPFCTCEVNDLMVTVSDCDTMTNTFDITVDFNWVGNVDAFNVFRDDVLIATINGADLPVTITDQIDDGGGSLVRVCGIGIQECCESVEVQVPQCGIEPCDIIDLSVEATNCDPETNTFDAVINFQWTGNSEMFNVYLGDDLIGTIGGADLPATIQGLVDDGGGAVFHVCSVQNPDCCDLIEIVPGCYEECSVFELTAVPENCNEETNTFDLIINFGWTGESAQFDVRMDGMLIGVVNGNSLPDTIFSVVDNGGGALIRVCSHADNDCCADVEIVPGCYEECDVFDVVAQALECDTMTNTFGLVIDFGWAGETALFDVFKGGQLIGSVDGTSLPDTLYGLIDDGGNALIRVCSHEMPDCCESVEIPVPACGVFPCEIFELSANAGDCTSDSTFTVAISFQFHGFTNDFVDVWTGDNYIGIFNANEQPIVINNFPWNGNAVMPLRVCQNDNEDCCMTIEFAVPECSEICDIQNLIVEPLGTCNPDSMSFPVFIDIDWLGDVSSFDIYANGEFFVTIEAAGLPDTLESFPVPSGAVAHLMACASGNNECCATVEFIAPDCTGEECGIFEISVDPVQCTSDSTFSAWVNYTPIGFDGSVQVWAGDVYLGSYPQIIPLLVPNIPEHDGGIVMTICQEENMACCGSHEFQGIVCEDVCDINNLTATPMPCDSGMFQVVLNFNFDNTGASFTVAGNGTSYGVFQYSQVPITLGPLAGDNTTSWEFVVIDLEHPGCVDFVELGTVDCITGVFDPARALPLEVQYGQTGASFVVPENASEFSLWSYDGKRVGHSRDIVAGQRVDLAEYLATPGLYIVEVRATDKIYVGKVVGF